MNILLVQTSFLGDIVLSTPVIKGLKTLYPDSRLSLLTTPQGAELLKNDPLLDDLIIYDKRGCDSGLAGMFNLIKNIAKKKFNVAYSLHRSYRTALLLRLSGIPRRVGFKEARGRLLYTETYRRTEFTHEVLRNLAIFRGERELDAFDDELRLFAPDDSLVKNELKSMVASVSPYGLVFPGSIWKTKRWSEIEYHRLVMALEKESLSVIIAGSKAEVDLCDRVAQDTGAVNLAGQTSMAELLWLCSRASFMVCNDSLALHLASAFKIPTVALFCSTVPEFGFGPWKNDRAVVLQSEGLACRPCGRHGRVKCPLGTEECMKAVRAEEVLHHLKALIKCWNIKSSECMDNV
ncbi:MAG: glycosyltransferase family 9 protein [Candidatus Dadabacteria bacterium]|nr:MAG: glycosyltransferase family 9 protein [Candidatus Dadabacteria bacterium]